MEDYLCHGGGVVLFLGERTRADFMNSRLYRDGQGMFPVPLVGPTELLVDRTEPVADLTVDAARPSGIRAVGSQVERGHRPDVYRSVFCGAKRRWTPAQGSTARVLVRLRNAAPLVVELKFGDGRVMAVLSRPRP